MGVACEMHLSLLSSQGLTFLACAVLQFGSQHQVRKGKRVLRVEKPEQQVKVWYVILFPEMKRH